MIVKLLTEHHLEFLSLKGCCNGSSEATLSSLQCYSVLSTIAQVLRKMSLKILVS